MARIIKKQKTYLYVVARNNAVNPQLPLAYCGRGSWSEDWSAKEVRYFRSKENAETVAAVQVACTGEKVWIVER